MKDIGPEPGDRNRLTNFLSAPSYESKQSKGQSEKTPDVVAEPKSADPQSNRPGANAPVFDNSASGDHRSTATWGDKADGNVSARVTGRAKTLDELLHDALLVRSLAAQQRTYGDVRWAGKVGGGGDGQDYVRIKDRLELQTYRKLRRHDPPRYIDNGPGVAPSINPVERPRLARNLGRSRNQPSLATISAMIEHERVEHRERLRNARAISDALRRETPKRNRQRRRLAPIGGEPKLPKARVLRGAQPSPAVEPTREREIELVRKAQAGDLEARNQIIVLAQPLIAFLAKPYADTPGITVEDLVSEINVRGAIESAIDAFDPDKGFRFSTFAKRQIEWAIWAHLKKQNRRLKTVSLNTPIVRANRTKINLSWGIVSPTTPATNSTPISTTRRANN